ncbi:N-acetylneuraminate synthase [Marivirga sp. S37H4]|uniref:N-acetylneuraminate synthase n=1 Tax=Marivirga aurantiaca TaxID=2802615 RepID=A0A934WWR4_9BACT|nr:N-acetylneuraminate synthase [Marivirga aurantiaca]MBK6264513.1 N-acetylneuraminate synthase [Marivirga aurantiaca]
MINLQKTIIIAEAGVNHNGDLERAKELIKVAAKAGADFVKFQTFKADKIVSKQAKKASYQAKNINDGDDSQYNMLKKLEIPDAWYPELLDLCKLEGIKFLSTGFDNDSINFLDELPIELFKIPSGEITNKPYLEHIATKKKPVILSTGMADIKEIKDAVTVLINAGLDKSGLTILHCNTEYPTPMADVNLKAMLHIKKELGVEIGYSDHTLGIEVPIAAVALGAKVIEKHFTLDRNLPGPDHKASLEPDELFEMIKSIRNIEMAIGGNGIKEPSTSEKENKKVVRKSIHTSKALAKGHVIKESDLIALRPGDGLSMMNDSQVIGRKLARDLNEFHKISISDLL